MLNKLDGWLTAIERAAWEARNVSNELVEASGELGRCQMYRAKSVKAMRTRSCTGMSPVSS